MRTDAFDFDLPEASIALRPARPRDSARLMVIEPGEANRHLKVSDLPELLRPGDVLVVNDTKVIPAVLSGTRRRGDNTARIMLTLFERVSVDTWRAFARPAKRLRAGDVVETGSGKLSATVAEDPANGAALLRFNRSGPDLDRALAEFGQVPLPSYISARRDADAEDRTDYQTMFARAAGAIAAPTAGLHFTQDLVDRIGRRGAKIVAVTLHVGPGTFLPVKVDDIAAHRMHGEWGTITPAAAETINAARQGGGRVVAVGTTSLRLLESAADEAGNVGAFAGETALFITPGYRFRAVDLLMTNFHLPRSTLFMLVSAFSGLERMRSAYKEAIGAGYRFYSYGDACLLHPEQGAR
jgi:S-adenosylmethionine:tRNA ribosyltransferase-isomerase